MIHPSKRVNGSVNRVNHPSKGEWGFARYTLAKFFSSIFTGPNTLFLGLIFKSFIFDFLYIFSLYFVKVLNVKI